MSDRSQSSPADIQQGKKVEFYAALVNAWIGTRMEIDKQVLALSALGLGGLIALASKGIDTWSAFVVGFLSGACFFIATILTLIVLSLNAGLLANVIKNEETKATAGPETVFVDLSGDIYARVLSWLDVIGRSFFVGGILFACVFAFQTTVKIDLQQPTSVTKE